MTLIGLLALGALAVAAISLTRLSRLPQAAPPLVEERSFETLRAGDVVLTPQGDWLVGERSALGEAEARADLFQLRSGREQRWLLVPKTGALALTPQRPAAPDLEQAARAQGALRLERPTVQLLPGA